MNAEWDSIHTHLAGERPHSPPTGRLTSPLTLLTSLWLVTAVGSGMAQAETVDPLRLSTDLMPLKESLDLTLDPRQNDYSGTATIALEARKAISSFRFHSKAIDIKTVQLSNTAGPVPLKFVPEGEDFIRVTPASALAAGPYQLEIKFQNDFNRKAISLYKLETEGESYLFSQFESMFAREAFPCWDEPEFKIPWSITLTVPQGQEALSNMPAIKEEPQANGWKRLSFKPTPPMSSYLLAFAAGPLEYTPIPGMSIPGRVVTVKGHSTFAKEAATKTPALLKALETWFDSKYPYDKLDLVAAPEFMYGAMENPGAIVFKESTLLMDSAHLTPDDLTSLYLIVTHELAHSWFGDLVTMRWWNDLWLNESFASWMATKIVTQVHRELRLEIHSIHTPQGAMEQDTLLTTRPIRREVPAIGDALHNIGLHYSKGESMLSMFERYLGAETFRRGVLTHLKTHAWGNATAEELFAAFEKEGGRAVISPMETFLNQAGVPVVQLVKLDGHSVTLKQSRIVPLGTEAPAQLWQIPVTLRFDDGNKVRTLSHLMRKQEETLVLKGDANPTWIHLNDGEQGYYRWQVPESIAKALLSETIRMSPREKLGFLSNAYALVGAGLMPGEQYLAVLDEFGTDRDPAILLAVCEQLEKLWAGTVRGNPSLEAPFAKRIRTMLSPILTRLGTREQPGESIEVIRLRGTVFYLLGHLGKDPKVRADARAMFDAWLKDPSSLSDGLKDSAISVAAESGDVALFNAYQKQFETTASPQDRQLFLGALGFFEDPALEARAREYVLKGPLRPHEMHVILAEQSSWDPAHAHMLQFVMQHYDELVAPISPEFRVFMPFLLYTCQADEFKAGYDFFQEKSKVETGMQDFLGQVKEGVESCIKSRAQNTPAVSRWLQVQSG